MRVAIHLPGLEPERQMQAHIFAVQGVFYAKAAPTPGAIKESYVQGSEKAGDLGARTMGTW